MNNSTQFVNGTTTSQYVITTELWIQYIVFYIVFGIVAILENIFIIILTAVDKKLWTFFFVLIVGHSIGEILHCAGNVVAGIYRLLPAIIPEIIILTRLQCHFVSLLLYFAPGFNSLTMVILAIDRSFAVGKPTSYHKNSAKRASIILVVSLIFSLIAKIGPSYTGSTPFSSQIPCTTSKAAVTPDWWNYNYYFNCFLIFLSIFLYVALLFISLSRARALSTGTFSTNDTTNKLLKRQLKLLGTVKVLIVINVLTTIPYVVLLIMSNYYTPPTAPRLVVYGACLNAIDMLIEPFSLYVSSSALKNAFKLLTKGVEPTTELFSKRSTVATTRNEAVENHEF